jgi:hypothetical protein
MCSAMVSTGSSASADAPTPPVGVHAAGQVDPARVGVGRHRVVPAVRDQLPVGVPAEDAVTLRIGSCFVQLLGQLVDAVPLTRPVVLLDGGQQPAQVRHVRSGQRTPGQSVLVGRRVCHVLLLLCLLIAGSSDDQDRQILRR